MSDVVIRVENLGKQYRIGQRKRYNSLRESLVETIRHPLRRFRSSRNGRPSTPDTFWALKDVSFDVKQGEVVGIIGRNGAGKSTLLKILSRITEPTEGLVDLTGRVGSLLEVGTGFHPELTGRENVYLNGAILGMRREEITRKFDEIVAFAEVEKFIDTPAKHYSSGMYMRLAFSVAAHLEPEILVVDEVLAVGDAAFQKKCLGKMSEVSRQGRTVLFVSHNMNAIEELCGDVILLRAGELAGQSRDVRKLVLAYLKGDGSGASLAEWNNPGHQLQNPWFTPARFYVGDASGVVLDGPARNDSQLYVYVEGEIDLTDPGLDLGYHIFTCDGQLLYWCLASDQSEASWPRWRRGPHKLRTSLPSRFLNEGDYRLELHLGLYRRTWISQPGVNAPAIQFSILGGLSDSPHWMHRRPGLLAPVLQWEV